MASDLERRDLVDQRFQSLIIGGAGLILMAIGWIAFDITRSRHKKDEELPSVLSAVPEASLQ